MDEKGGQLGLKQRLTLTGLLAILMGVGFSMPLPKSPAYRVPVFIAALVVAFVLASRARTRPPEPTFVPPQGPEPATLSTELGAASVRVDSSTSTWLTVAGAAHSAAVGAIIATSKWGFNEELTTRFFGIAGLLLILGSVCQMGAHRIHRTRDHYERVAFVAQAHPTLGPYYVFTHPDDEHWAGTLAPTLLASIANAWLMGAAAFFAMATLLVMLGV